MTNSTPRLVVLGEVSLQPDAPKPPRAGAFTIPAAPHDHTTQLRAAQARESGSTTSERRQP